MSVIRTSLSLISFGFTIYQFFRFLEQSGTVAGAKAPATNFGQALLWLGVGMLTLGIIYHVQFMYGIRVVRAEMANDGYIHGQSVFPISLTLVTAILLLLIGIAAIVSITFRIAPFG